MNHRKRRTGRGLTLIELLTVIFIVGLLVAMLSYLASNASHGMVFALEEPEAFLHPAAQGRGLGALLTLAGLHYMAALTPGGPGRDEAGLDEVELYVEGDNTAALNTYSKLGFTRYTADIAYRRQ